MAKEIINCIELAPRWQTDGQSATSDVLHTCILDDDYHDKRLIKMN